MTPQRREVTPQRREVTPQRREVELRWAGPRALLVECATLDGVLAFHAHVAAHPFRGQVDAVAAARTVLLTFGTDEAARAAAGAVPDLAVSARAKDAGGGHGREVLLEVVYDGEDLAEVGRLTGLGPDGVVAAHTGQAWTAAFGGFAPGFVYLAGEDGRLDVPRRSEPRTAVPAGAVALGGEFSAVYPRRSPGGWQLIGHTDARVWDLERDPPALIRPGDTVRHVAVRERVVMREAPAEAADLAPATPSTGQRDAGQHDDEQRDAEKRAAEQRGRDLPSPALEILSPGLQALVQDLGRPGLGDLGVPGSGAADRASALQANRLVGNEPGDAVVEAVWGGLDVRAEGDLVLAVAGAHVPLEVRDVSGEAVARPRPCEPFPLLDGQRLILGAPSVGLRAYVAVRGGVAVAPVLGSRSTDTLSGIGPAPLMAGARLPIGAGQRFHAVVPEEGPDVVLQDEPMLRIVAGPREDWFAAGALEVLTGQAWEAQGSSDRVGVRLRPAGAREGNARPRRVIERSREGELRSEGMVAGALQVPPSGEPVLFLADHPVTGGYPVIAVVVPEDLPLAAQLVPGQRVRFRSAT